MPDVSALRKLAASLAKPFDPGPRYQSWGSFTMTAKGLEVEKTEGRGEARKTVQRGEGNKRLVRPPVAVAPA
jgi:hypothetical protein